MKKLVNSLILVGLISSSSFAKECVTLEQRVSFGTIGVLQGTVIGGPVGALWGLGIALFATNYDSCTNSNINKELVEPADKNSIRNVESKEVFVSEKKIPDETQVNSDADNSKAIQSFVNFGFNSFAVKGANIDYKILKDEKIKQIIVEGHTDSVGTNEYNFALGLKRASNVKHWLVKKQIPENKLSIVSLGETSPISDDDSINRRVDLKIYYNK